jgi:phenylacetate-CoA ligase
VEEIERFRDERLTRLVALASATAPFYREHLRQAGVSPEEIQTLEDLRRLPVLTKAQAQTHAAALVSRGVPNRDAQIVHTSGTTGAALRFPMIREAIQEQWAVWWRYRAWHGITFGTRCALFAGRSIVPIDQTEPPFWRHNAPGRQLLFSGYHMSPRNLPAYVDELQRRRPPWLHGYPSLLALLAAYLLESGTELGYDVRWVTTGAENLLPHQSAVMEHAFGVKPIQHYGLTEGVANISECEYGTLHVDEDFAAVEFIPVGANGLHRIVGTNLSNPATPLLRYDTHDLATLSSRTSCTCGRPGRIVSSIDGRREDYVVLGNGTRVGRMDHVFKDMVNIKEAQIYQSQAGRITIRVVRGDRYKATDEHALMRETAKRVGDDTAVEIEYVDGLPRSSVGKLRFVISEVPDAAIDGVPSSAGGES